MRDLKLFGTHDYPLHPSGLKGLVACPWRIVMRFLYESGEESVGQPADTGSATHAAVHALHSGASIAESLQAMQDRKEKYPTADLSDAAQLFLAYATDPANRDARVILTEEPVAFQISAAKHDPTGAPIQVEGTCDQVRERKDGRYEVWDLKTSKKDAIDILHNSTVQIAAYCVGASVKLGRAVHPGGVILPRKYPKNAHWRFAWSWDDIEHILEGVRNAVADVRSGRVVHVPQNECVWCHAKSPDLCLPRLKKFRHELEMQNAAQG